MAEEEKSAVVLVGEQTVKFELGDRLELDKLVKQMKYKAKFNYREAERIAGNSGDEDKMSPKAQKERLEEYRTVLDEITNWFNAAELLLCKRNDLTTRQIVLTSGDYKKSQEDRLKKEVENLEKEIKKLESELPPIPIKIKDEE